MRYARTLLVPRYLPQLNIAENHEQSMLHGGPDQIYISLEIPPKSIIPHLHSRYIINDITKPC